MNRSAVFPPSARPALHAGARRSGAVATLVVALGAALVACSGSSEKELVASAQSLLDKKDDKAAVIQLKNAIQKDPKSGEARFLLGKTLLGNGDPVAALVELRKAQELQVADERVVPELARAMLLLGEEAKILTQYGDTQLRDDAAGADLKTTLASAHAVQKNMDGARKAVQDALRLKPGYAPAIIVQARLAAVDGDIDGALALLDTVMQAEPGNERAGAFKGELLWQIKREPDAAITAFRTVLAAHPESTGARAAVTSILLQQGKVEDARREFAALKKTAANHPETLYLEAQLAFADKNYKGAREVSDRILKVMPDHARVLELAGAAEFRMKNYLQAEALLSRALKVAPKQTVSRLLLAQTYLRSGQPNKTVEALRPMIEVANADGSPLALAGEAYLQLGDLKRSDDAYQRALKAAPGDARVRTSAAMAQMVRGNSSGAISELEAVAGSDSGSRADLALVSARLRQNDLPGALKAIDALERKLPDQALPHNLRGRVLLLKRDVPGATKSFEAALAKDPAFFPAVASLAAIEVAAGKPDAARKRLEEHLQTQPKSYQAKMVLAELDARTGAPAEKVTASLRDAVKIDASEPAPHLALVNRLIAGGDAKAALVAAQDASAALPSNLEIADALGRAQMASGDYQRAITTFKQLASAQPRNPMHEMRSAEAHLALKDNEAAARSLRRALELQPELTVAKRGLASLAMADKRPQDALAIAKDLQQKSPKDAAGFALEGEIESSRKNWDAAVAAYRAGLQRAPAADMAVKLHMALAAGKKPAEADKLSADWLKDHPKDAVFRYYLGDLALAQGDSARAEAQYRGVLEIQPDNALALNNVAWLLAKQNKPGAVAAAERANTLMPNRAALVDTLALALDADNQLPKAIETQKRAIALEPKDHLMAMRLAKLYIKSGDKARARAELESLAQLGDKFTAQAEVASLLKTL